MLEKFFEGNYHWIVVIIIAIWLLDKLRPDYENKKEKARARGRHPGPRRLIYHPKTFYTWNP